MNSMLGRYAAIAIVAAMQICPVTLAYGQPPMAPAAQGCSTLYTTELIG